MKYIMTRKNKISTAIIILIFLTSSITSAGTINGSPHDFRGYPLNRSGEICNPCHAMHGTKTLPYPRWDPELPTQTYIMYSRTRSPAIGTATSDQPDGMSKICLSCHDGIVAPDAYGGITSKTDVLFDKDTIGTVSSNNHPISFIYNTALTAKDRDLYDPSTKLSGMTGSTGTINKDLLFLNRMECASCHDVHNTNAVPGTKLLVKDISESMLCYTCHNK
jgi:predicted CXXCH cytochrome family protein